MNQLRYSAGTRAHVGKYGILVNFHLIFNRLSLWENKYPTMFEIGLGFDVIQPTVNNLLYDSLLWSIAIKKNQAVDLAIILVFLKIVDWHYWFCRATRWTDRCVTIAGSASMA